MAPDGKKHVVLAPEIQFARKLANKEKTVRDSVLKKLRQWIISRSGQNKEALSEDELLRIWTGLFYCLWMQDKLLLQEELCGKISSLLLHMKSAEVHYLFLKTFFTTMSREWSRIDVFRMDKFMLLVRRILRSSLAYVLTCCDSDGDEDIIRKWCEVVASVVCDGCIATSHAAHTVSDTTTATSTMTTATSKYATATSKATTATSKATTATSNATTTTSKTTSNPCTNVPMGVRIHVIDIFIDELNHISTTSPTNQLTSDIIIALLQPMISILQKEKNVQVLRKVEMRVFHELIMTSPLGRRLALDQSASTTEPTDTADELDDGSGDTCLNVDFGTLADVLFKAAAVSGKDGTAGSATGIRYKNRRLMYDLVKKCRDLSAGVYPLVDYISSGSDVDQDDIDASVNTLLRLHEEGGESNESEGSIESATEKPDPAADNSTKAKKLNGKTNRTKLSRQSVKDADHSKSTEAAEEVESDGDVDEEMEETIDTAGGEEEKLAKKRARKKRKRVKKKSVDDVAGGAVFDGDAVISISCKERPGSVGAECSEGEGGGGGVERAEGCGQFASFDPPATTSSANLPHFFRKASSKGAGGGARKGAKLQPANTRQRTSLTPTGKRNGTGKRRVSFALGLNKTFG